MNLLLLLLLAQDTAELTVAAHEKDRRLAIAEHVVALEPPLRVRQKDGAETPCQWEKTKDGTLVRWLVAEIPAGKTRTYVVEKGDAAAKTVTIESKSDGSEAVVGPQGEITRYWTHDKFRHPYFHPLVARGVQVTRGFPMEPREGETKDHPHHTGLWFAHGDVNGKDYWSRLPIADTAPMTRMPGAVYATIAGRSEWGEDLRELTSVRIYAAGEDVLMDWTITLRAKNGPVTLGKTKEGSFAIRLRDELAEKNGGKISFPDGRSGEKECWGKAAPWCDYSGTIDGKKIGVAIMSHPTSFRHPPEWHVRGYGLFAANPFLAREPHRLEKGESVTMRFRLYVHGTDGKPADVYEGYANPPNVTSK